MQYSKLLIVSLLLPLACSEYSLDEKIEPEIQEDTGSNSIGTDTATTDTSDPDTEEPINENAPMADCSVAPNPVTPPFEAAIWDGSGSTAGAGSPIAMYYWELVQKPEGSAASLPYQSGIKVSDFYADMAGDYVAQLTVTNEQGYSDTCQATLEAVPSQNLWVEMFWQHSGDDMDLHLLAPGGTKETDSDCYWANCTFGLEWGAWGPDDNPWLDLDDIQSTGPENINIEIPETTGEYTVIVHDYPGSVLETANDVTINIYLGSSLVWSKTKTITGEDSFTPFAKINWGHRIVTDL
jgi:hypothetical protein